MNCLLGAKLILMLGSRTEEALRANVSHLVSLGLPSIAPNWGAQIGSRGNNGERRNGGTC
jgi:hypothetical protein